MTKVEIITELLANTKSTPELFDRLNDMSLETLEKLLKLYNHLCSLG